MGGRSKKAARLSLASLLLTAAAMTHSMAMNWQEGMDAGSLRGSFFSTCLACVVDGQGFLSCRCRKNNGNLAARHSLQLGFCDSAGPDNIDGNLACRPILRGSWAASCENGYVFGEVLNASCRDTGGDFHDAQMNLGSCPGLELENLNGRLFCKP
jgi:hypothetical protein